jgi:hypothetical protein
VSGEKTQAPQGDYDIWVVKTNAQGTKLWDKRYGGPAREALNSVIQTSDGGYLLGGSSESSIGGNKTQSSRGSTDFWLVKLSSTGMKQWDRRIGGSGFDYLNKVVQLPTGEYIIAGVSNSPADGDKSQPNQGDYDMWVVKLSATGTKLWDKRFGGAQREYTEGLVALPEGGCLVAGYSASGISGNKTQASQGGYDYWVLKLTSTGDKVWDKRFGGTGDDKLAALLRTSSGSYLLGGSSRSPVSGNKSQASRGGYDYWLVKISSSGSMLWEKRYGGEADDQLAAMMQTQDGSYLLGGSSASGNIGDKRQASQGGSDYWLVKVDGKGIKQWDQRFGGAGTEELRSVSATPDGKYLLGGHSTSGVSGDRTQPSQGGTDYWLVKVAPITTASSTKIAQVNIPTQVEEQEVAFTRLSAAPNPFTDGVNISFTLPQTQAATLKLYDNQGKEIINLFQGKVGANIPQQVQWQPENKLATGLYIIRLQTPTQINTCKIMLRR